jgi:hypothetical protein
VRSKFLPASAAEKYHYRIMNPRDLLCSLLALLLIGQTCIAATIRTLQGEEFKDATVSRVEPDGITVTHSTGVVKIPFTNLSADIQAKYHYDPRAAERFVAAHRTPPPSRTVLSTPTPPPLPQQSEPQPSLPEEVIPDTPTPSTPSQIDAAQFDDLRRRDWYEDLKKQKGLKAEADFKLGMIAEHEKEGRKGFEKCTPSFFTMLSDEREKKRKNYRALSSIAAEIMVAATYEEYKKLKAVEEGILADIDVQKLVDHNHVSELRLRVSERDAALLEITQQYE